MRALAAVTLLVSTLCFAGWRQLGTLPGTPQDVQVVDAGMVLAVSSGAGTASTWRVSDAGITQVDLPGNFVGAGLFDSNCIVALSTTRLLIYSAGCGLPSVIGANTPVRFRLFSNQLSGVALFASGSFDTLYSGPEADGGWNVRGATWVGASTRTLQTARLAGAEYAVMNSGSALIKISVDGGAPFDVTTVGPLRDAALFSYGGTPSVIGSVLATGGLSLIADLNAPVQVTPVVPPGRIVRYLSIGGLGGMATTATGEILSPIPNPARVGEVWTVRTGVPSAFTERINCLDDKWCASVTSAGNVWLWENSTVPHIAVASVRLDAGQSVRLVADAGDADGDPVYVSWAAPGATLSPVAGIDDGTQIDFSVPSGNCGFNQLEATVRDGPHSQTIQVPVTVVDRGALQVNAPLGPVFAGGPPLEVTAFIDGGCEVPTITWTSTDGQTGALGQFSWVPPVTECTAGGRTVAVSATATWSGGAFDTETIQFTLEPWGAPPAPVFPSPAAQVGGTSVVWSPVGPAHSCANSAGFPGTQLLWTVDGGEVPVVVVDGGLRVDAPISCVPLQVMAFAESQVLGEQRGRTSDAGVLVVDIFPDVVPLNASTPFDVSFHTDGGLAFGALSVQASCVSQRMLESQVTVSQGAVSVASGRFATPGEWALSVPGSCAGGAYEVHASLLEDGGFTGAEFTGSFTLGLIPVRVGSLSVNRLDVVCGSGVDAQVSLVAEPNSCTDARFSWRQSSGPELVRAGGEGLNVDVQTVATDFSLVGQQLVFDWVADAGPSNVDVASRAIDLGVQPFIETTVRQLSALRREEDAMMFEATLRNTTGCAVDGLTTLLGVNGGTLVGDAVVVDGVSRRVAAGELLENISVPALASTSIQFAVRPRLLAVPVLEPVVSLRGYRVSFPGEPPSPVQGCGCSTASALIWAAVLYFRKSLMYRGVAGRSVPR